MNLAKEKVLSSFKYGFNLFNEELYFIESPKTIIHINITTQMKTLHKRKYSYSWTEKTIGISKNNK